MATDIEIANNALAKIRGRFINTLDDATTEARLCKRLLPMLRDRLLVEIAPNWAKQRLELASIVDGEPAYGFDYAFALPSNVLRVLETDRYSFEDWKQENGRIYGNDSTFMINAVVRVEDYETFDPMFAETLAYLLASELALPLTNGTSIANGLKAQAEDLIRRTRSISAQQRGSVDQPEATDWLLARY